YINNYKNYFPTSIRADIVENKNLIIKCSRMFSDINMFCAFLVEAPDQYKSAVNLKSEIRESISKNAVFFSDPGLLERQICEMEKKLNQPGENAASISLKLRNLVNFRDNFEKNLEVYNEKNKKIKLQDEEIEKNEKKIIFCFSKIYENMEGQLNISHNPYQKRNFYFSNCDFIFIFIIFSLCELFVFLVIMK
ncbi:hypothetical protein, partial [Acetobacter syzygii]